MKRLLSYAIAFSLGAIALPVNAAVQVYKDSTGSVYISGLGKDEFVKIAYGGIQNKIQVKPSGTCNFLKVPYKASEPGFYPWDSVSLSPVGEQSSVLSFTGNDLQTVDIVGKSLCDGSKPNINLSWTTLTGGAYGLKDANFKAVYIVGLPYKVYEAKDGAVAIRRQKANSCGILKVSDTPTWPVSKLETFYFYANSQGRDASGDYAPASLPVKNPEFCRNGVLYKPSK